LDVVRTQMKVRWAQAGQLFLALALDVVRTQMKMGWDQAGQLFLALALEEG
jgi:hypothetical protein